MNWKKIVLWTMVFVLCLNTVLALGIRPVKTQIQFQPEYNGAVKVVNNDHTYLQVVIYAEGELEEYIKISETELVLEPDEEFKSIGFKIDITDELPPGLRTGRIIVEEKISSVTIAGSYVSGSLKMAHKIEVQVPYPDKYIEVQIDIQEEQEGVDISTTVKNIGASDIDQVKPVIEIYSGSEKISTFEATPTSLSVLEESNFNTFVQKAELGQGVYTVNSRISFDGNSLELAKTFAIGEPLLRILNYEKYVVENKINEFPIEVKNDWNSIIKDAKIELFFLKGGNEVSKETTYSFDIGPYEGKRVQSYFDTTGLEVGQYDVNMLIHHGNKTDIERHELSIITQEEYDKRLGGDALMYIVVALAAAVVLILGVLLYVIIGMRNGKKGKRFK